MVRALGTEVHLARNGAVALADDGIVARVVSMPSMERVEDQPAIEARCFPRQCLR